MQRNDDLNMIGLLREVWAAKVFLTIGLSVGLLAAFAFIVVSKPQFEARMMVGPAQPLEASMEARFENGQNSYVLGREQNNSIEVVSNFTRFQAMMRGVSVARLLLRDRRIVEGLESDVAFVFGDGREGIQPTELAKYIGARVKLDRFGESALREMVYRHRDGRFAAYFVQQIHRTTDQLIRAELRGQVDERIAYLERVIAKTVNAEQRRIMTNLLLEQQRARMMVSMDAPVAAIVVEPAASSAGAVWPDAGLLYSGLGFLGLFLGYLVFGVVHYREEDEVLVAPRGRGAGVVPQKNSGQDLRHEPKRPLKYGSWFQGAPDNDVDADDKNAPRKDASDAAE